MNAERARPLAAFTLVAVLCAGVMAEGLRPTGGSRATRAESPSAQQVQPGETLHAVGRRTAGRASGAIRAALDVRSGATVAATAAATSTVADRPRRPRGSGDSPASPQGQDPAEGHQAAAGSVAPGPDQGEGNGHGKKPAKRPTKPVKDSTEQSAKEQVDQDHPRGRR